MHRILLVAQRDYLATVRTKAFLVGLVVAPLLFGGGMLGVALLKAKPDIADRHVAIVDRVGDMAAAIVQAAGEKSAREAVDKDTGRQVEPRYLFESVTADGDAKAQRLALSDRVRSHDSTRFWRLCRAVEEPLRVSCYSNTSGIDDARRWFDGPVTEGIQRVRLAQLGVDPSRFKDLLAPVAVERLSLVTRDEKNGAIHEAHKKSELEGFAVPFGLMMLLGMIVLVGSSPMLPAVTEDKAQRIVEMLLGLATPWELMMGKVLAAVGISLTSSAFYVIGGTLALEGMGLAAWCRSPCFPGSTFTWFPM